MDRQHNDQQKEDKRTNNDLQNTPQKTKYWATRLIVSTYWKIQPSMTQQGPNRVDNLWLMIIEPHFTPYLIHQVSMNVIQNIGREYIVI